MLLLSGEATPDPGPGGDRGSCNHPQHSIMHGDKGVNEMSPPSHPLGKDVSIGECADKAERYAREPELLIILSYVAAHQNQENWHTAMTSWSLY